MKQERTRSTRKLRTRVVNLEKPKTRVYIKQEEEEVKDYFKSASSEISNIQEENIIEPKRPACDRHCIECDYTFETKILYSSHIKQYHTGEDKQAIFNKPQICDICNIQFQAPHYYRRHMAAKHKISVLNDTQNLNAEDPNHYCNVCDFKFISRKIFVQHIKHFHEAVFCNKTPQAILKDIPAPVIDNPGLHCAQCKKTYKNKSSYRIHLIRIHFMELPKLVSDPSQIDFDGLECKTCKKTFKGRRSLKVHARRMHGVDYFKSTVIYADIKPDVNDPNFYCKPCDRTLSEKESYVKHLAYMHTSIMPEIFEGEDCHGVQPKDSRNYCAKCDRIFYAKWLFRLHFEKFHGTAAAAAAGTDFVNKVNSPHFDLTPDKYDPNNHCAICDKTYSFRSSYLRHLFHIHGIKVNRPICLPGGEKSEKELVVDHVTRYCNVCEKSYSTDTSYNYHLSLIHGEVPPRSGQHKSIMRKETPVIDLKDFICTACNKKYKDRESYGAHIRVIHNLTLSKGGYWNVNPKKKTKLSCSKKT